MFKKFIVAAIILALVFVCSACGETECVHEWSEATCTDAKTCSLCGIVEGEALGHSWVDATYEAPKTCSGCGITEGEKLFDPAYSEENVLASEAMEKLQPYLDFLIVSKKELVYDEDLRSLNLILVPTSGAADAYAGRGDQWGLYTAYLKTLTTIAPWFFHESGLEISLCVTLLDDRDGTSVLYEAQDGYVSADVYSGIVPEFLKSNAFEITFSTTYMNYGDKYEITANYNEESGILYFFIKLDAGTSMLFNSISNSEVLSNRVWQSLTDAVTRWSAEYTAAFALEGSDTLCVYMLLDGTTVEDAYFAVGGGEVIYNCFE